MSRIFISYRRDDARGWAPALLRGLASHFASENLFYDRQTIQGGDNWRAVIETGIRQSDAVVVLIGPDWIGPGQGRLLNRLTEPGDIVRREVELALSHGVWTVPVLLDGRAPPVRDEIPDSLQPLLSLHMLQVRPDIFDEDVERLLTLLQTRLRDPGQIANSLRRRKFAWLLSEHVRRFGGREEHVARVKSFLDIPAERALLIQAPAGYGKTSLIAHILADTETPYAFHLFNRSFDADSVTERDFLASLVEQLMAWQGLREEVTERDMTWMKGQFSALLKGLPPRDHVAILDGLDEIGADWRIQPYVEQLLPSVRILATARSGGIAATAMGFELSEAVYELQGFDSDDIKSVLVSAGSRAAGHAANQAVIDEIARVAASEEPGSTGADPFVVRFLAEDIQSGNLDVRRLATEPSGLTPYLERWFAEISDAAGGDERPMWALGMLAVARAPLAAPDLARLLPPIAGRLVQPNLEQTLRPVRRFVSLIPGTGFQLVHARLARYLREHMDTALVRDRLIADSLSWRSHFSDYALRWLLADLVEAERLDEAWQVVTDEDTEGRNLWYTGHAEVNDERAQVDRLRWYTDGLELLFDAYAGADRPPVRALAIALLRSSQHAISDRVPSELLSLMASMQGGMGQRALTLARRKSRGLDRLEALSEVIVRLDPWPGQAGMMGEALSIATSCRPHKTRSLALGRLAAFMRADEVRRALDLVLEKVDIAAHVAAAADLVATLPEADATQVHGVLWQAIESQRPLSRAMLLSTWARRGLPGAEHAAAEAVGLLEQALADPLLHSPYSDDLTYALVEVARCAQIPWETLQEVLRERDDKEQAYLLGGLLSEQNAVPVIPCLNRLLELEACDARGRAIRDALPQLCEEDCRKVLFGVAWDVTELSWMTEGLPESLRAEAAQRVLAQVLSEEPVNHAQASVLARIARFLPTEKCAQAIEFMHACASKMPLVPPHEQISRQVALMLRVNDSESGKPVEFSLSTGPSRADTLTLIASIVEPEDRRIAIEEALRAAQAIDDRYESALFVAELAAACPESGTRLQCRALDLIAGISWDATRSDALVQVSRHLTPEAREFALGKLDDMVTEARERAEANLLASRVSLGRDDVEQVLAFAQRESADQVAGVIEALADKVDDAGVSVLMKVSLAWEDTNEASRAATALAHRLAPASLLDVLTARSWTVQAVGSILQAMRPTEQAKYAASILARVEAMPTNVAYAQTLAMLLRIHPSGLDIQNAEAAIVGSLPEMAPDTSLEQLARVAVDLPDDSPLRDVVVDAVLQRRPMLERPDDWGNVIRVLALGTPAARLSSLLASITTIAPEYRAIGLTAIAQQMARLLPSVDQREALSRILVGAAHDTRRDVLNQVRAALPLLVSTMSEAQLTTLADEVMRLQHWFP